MSLVDSKAVFVSNLTTAGVSDRGIGLLTVSGLDSLSKMAYSSSAVPGGPDEAAYGPDNARGAGALAALRRVWHEAYIAVCAVERDRSARTDETGPKRVPLQERAA
eukprot:6382367-Amphidinium_carterae.1